MKLQTGKIALRIFFVVLLGIGISCGCERLGANVRRLGREIERVTETQRHDNPNIYADFLRKYDAHQTLVGLKEWELRKILFKADIDPIQASFADPKHVSRKSLCFSIAPGQQLLVGLVDGRVTSVEFMLESH